MEIAPGIHRLGSGLVNVYLFQESGGVTIVDAGAAGYWNDLPAELASMGRSLDDVRAVILTHAHSDHVGFAERIRRERRVPIKVHDLDAALARGETKPVRDPTARFRFRPLPALGFLAWGAAHGLLRTTPIREVATFGDGATLDLPGSPRVIHVPGHTAGSAALHVAGLDAIFVGDALATQNVLTGQTGPQLAPFGADFRQAAASLQRLIGVAATYVLPGHGQAWTSGIDEAVRLAKASVET